MRYAVFISYSRASDFLKQWALNFGRDLEDKLQEKTPGGQAEVFIDSGDVGVGPLSEAFQNALADSAILLIVLSSRWLESKWCHSELEAFVAATGDAARSRIAIVRLEDIKKHRSALTLSDRKWGDFLGGLHEYDFFTIDPEKKVPLVYGAPDLGELRREYLVTLLELVGDEARPGLVSRIQDLGPQVQEPARVIAAQNDNRPKVFLADGTPDLNKDRRTLRDYLEAEGYCVVPNRSFYNASPAVMAEVEHLLDSSRLFIQVLGRFRFDTTETFPDGYEVWQLLKARRLKGKDVLRWRRPDFQESDVEESAHGAFVFDKDVIACDLPEFKTTLAAKLKEIHSRIDDSGRVLNQDVGKRVLFNVTSADNTFGEELGARFEDLALNARLTGIYADLVSEQSSLYDIALNNVWHGLVVVYGQGQKEWAVEQMRQARAAALADKRKPCRIYLRPSDKPAPEPRPVRFRLIRDGAEDELLQLLQEVVAL